MDFGGSTQNPKKKYWNTKSTNQKPLNIVLTRVLRNISHFYTIMHFVHTIFFCLKIEKRKNQYMKK
jgi:hypothetical protein